MRKLLSERSPSEAVIDLLKLNGMSEAHIRSSVKYLKAQTELENIDHIEGYDSWNAFFIMFCIKAHDEHQSKQKDSS